MQQQLISEANLGKVAKKTLLLELLCEEIPSFIQGNASSFLLNAVATALNKHNISLWEGVKIATPRRIGFIIRGIPDMHISWHKEIKGPRTNASESALSGFLNKYGAAVKQLRTKGDHYYLECSQGLDIRAVLIAILQEALNGIIWPKSMRWGAYQMRCIRPMHNILCLFGNEILQVQYMHLNANNKTYGHRFMCPGEVILEHADNYIEQMRDAYVETDIDARQRYIGQELQRLAHEKNIILVEDNKLLAEVAGLTEYPVISLGRIDERFLSLPKEVLAVVLRHHQKYFMFEQKTGEVAPYFGIVANVQAPDNNDSIIEGNQRVLKARLYDAEFFFAQDKKAPLCTRVHMLKSLAFYADIGSIYDKMQSVKLLARKLAKVLKVDPILLERAVELAKADLVTEMVGEFPELQGIMGYYYSLAFGEREEVAIAIKEHYKPQGPADSLPASVLGGVLAIADKLDTLQHMFAHGIKPSGSKDPYALRRAAIGIRRIQEAFEFDIPMEDIGVPTEVVDFIRERNVNR